MNRIFRRRFAFLLLFLVIAASVAQAQETPPPAAEPPALTDGADAAEGDKKQDAAFLGLVGEGKYKAWVHHVGVAEEAVVAVRVTATDAAGNAVTRTGSGFVLRCDGFVVVPEALAPLNDRNFKAELTFVKRDGEELNAPLVPTGRPLFRSRKIPYVTLKVNNSHFPGLPVLNPVNVRPDAPVRVTWAIPDEQKPGRVKILSRKAMVGPKIGTKPSDVDRFALRLTDDKKTDALEPIIGAVVTDDKGIAALGILTAAPTAPDSLTFATFAHLDYICDAVGLCPTLADVPGKGAETAGVGMKFIPGGPIRVPPGVMGEFYGRSYKTDVVCTPPFRMDALPVTIGDYRANLRRFTAPRLPERWGRPSELDSDIRRADLPATGMLYEDAVAYAASLGKRLPTAVEWLKASQGANNAWYAQHDASISRIRKSGDDLYQAKLADYIETKKRTYRAKSPEAAAAANFYVDTEIMRELNRRQFEVQRKYFRRNWLPGMNSPVGFYPEDISASGVRDVLTNAPEMVIRNYAFPVSGAAPKPFPSVGDPYLTVIHILGRNNPADAPASETEFRRAIALQSDVPAEIDAVFALFLSNNPLWSPPATIYVEGSGNRPGIILFRPENWQGFRCAK